MPPALPPKKPTRVQSASATEETEATGARARPRDFAIAAIHRRVRGPWRWPVYVLCIVCACRSRLSRTGGADLTISEFFLIRPQKEKSTNALEYDIRKHHPRLKHHQGVSWWRGLRRSGQTSTSTAVRSRPRNGRELPAKLVPLISSMLVFPTFTSTNAHILCLPFEL